MMMMMMIKINKGKAISISDSWLQALQTGKLHSIALHSSERLCPAAPSSTNVGLCAWELSARMLYHRNRFFSNRVARAALAIIIFIEIIG